MTAITEEKNYKNLTIRISDQKLASELRQLLFSYLQLRNLILILIKRNYEEHVAQPEHRPQLFSYLTHPQIMRALLWGQAGGKLKEKVDFLRSYYAHDSMMREAQELGHSLKDKIILELVKQIQQSWKSFFALRKNGDSKAREPKAARLSSICNYSLPIDMECVSFKRKNKIRILMERGKSYFVHSQHAAILAKVGSFTQIKRMELCLKNGELYLLFSYLAEKSERLDTHQTSEPSDHNQTPTAKYAGLDLGVCRLLSIYIDDHASLSFMIDGQLFSSFNAEYNRKRAALLAELDPIKKHMQAIEKRRRAAGFIPIAEILKTDPDYYSFHRKRLGLEKRLSKLSRRRRGFFDSNFKKLAKRLVTQLRAQGVTHLVTSRNIIEKKSEGSTLGTVQNQKYYHIPFGQLFDAIKLFSDRYGLVFIDTVDEAYTSKTSCLSGDVLRAQAEKIPAELRSDVFQGRRVMRGSFEDRPSGKRIHADINAAANILRVYYQGQRALECQGPRLVKLANPRLIDKNALLCLLDRVIYVPCVEGELAPLWSPRFQVGA